MRTLCLLGCLAAAPALGLAAAGCQSTAPDRSLAPLPDKVSAMPYGRLLERARAQATAASEAFYVDNWAGLDEAARGLEQTALYLTKADDVPARHRDTLATAAADLGKLAGALRAATGAKDVKKINAALTGIQATVRGMRLGDG